MKCTLRSLLFYANTVLATGFFTEGKRFYSGDAFEGRNYWQVEPGVGRVANGVSNRVDRIKGLGNAIVPQVALEIFRAINKTLDVR